jgi:hypothetical protein
MASEGSSATPEQPMKPHTRHAFNYNLWGYDANTDEQVENQVIRLNRLTAPRDRNELVQKAYTVANGSHVASTEEGLDFDMDDESLLTAVVVGMRPSCSPLKTYGDAKLLKISEKRASVRSLTFKKNAILKHDPTALRVVCPRFQKKAVLYALTSRNEDTKLCDAVVISAEEVFFFPEFRNDTATDVHVRKKTCGEKIRAKIVGKISSKREVGDKIPVKLERNISTNLASF